MLRLKSIITLLSLLAAVLVSLPAQAQPAPAIKVPPPVSLLTYGPGRVYWERFGHDAILVGPINRAESLAYNYGIFDFNQKNFFINFARGIMNYRMAADPVYADLNLYASEERSVEQQRLNLDATQRQKLIDYLKWNALPENLHYRYDYFRNNCATKVRDAINHATGGELRRQLEAMPAPHTYRFEATRLIAPDPLMMLGMDLVMGPAGDQPLNMWQESFIPGILEQALKRVTITNAAGQSVPLIAEQRTIIKALLPPPPTAPPDLLLPFLIVGLLLAGLFWLLAIYRQTSAARWLFATLTSVFSLTCALSGTILIVIWLFTQHWAMHGNVNLLLLNPLCWLLLPTWVRAARRDWAPKRYTAILGAVIAIVAVLSLALRTMPGLHQHDLAWIALLIPPHIALAWILWRQSTKP